MIVRLSAVFLIAACAHRPAQPEDFARVGRQPTTLPATLDWCSAEVRRAASTHKDPRFQCIDDDEFCRKTAKLFADCVRPLSRESPRGKFVGKVVLSGALDEHGMLSTLCLLDSDMGDTPATLACIERKARAWPEPFEVNGSQQITWPITFWLE